VVRWEPSLFQSIFPVDRYIGGKTFYLDLVSMLTDRQTDRDRQTPGIT